MVSACNLALRRNPRGHSIDQALLPSLSYTDGPVVVGPHTWFWLLFVQFRSKLHLHSFEILCRCIRWPVGLWERLSAAVCALCCRILYCFCLMNNLSNGWKHHRNSYYVRIFDWPIGPSHHCKDRLSLGWWQRWLERIFWNHTCDLCIAQVSSHISTLCIDFVAFPFNEPLFVLFVFDRFNLNKFVEFQYLIRLSNIHSCDLFLFPHFYLEFVSFLQLFMQWKCLALVSPTQVYRWKGSLVRFQLQILLSGHPLFSLFFCPVSSWYTLIYHGILLDISTLVERNYSGPEILFENVSGASQAYFSCICYTCLNNDLPFNMGPDCWGILASFQHQPSICPNYQDPDRFVLSNCFQVMEPIHCFIAILTHHGNLFHPNHHLHFQWFLLLLEYYSIWQRWDRALELDCGNPRSSIPFLLKLYLWTGRIGSSWGLIPVCSWVRCGHRTGMVATMARWPPPFLSLYRPFLVSFRYQFSLLSQLLLVFLNFSILYLWSW